MPPASTALESWSAIMSDFHSLRRLVQAEGWKPLKKLHSKNLIYHDRGRRKKETAPGKNSCTMFLCTIWLLGAMLCLSGSLFSVAAVSFNLVFFSVDIYNINV